jgi:hypothetical protein
LTLAGKGEVSEDVSFEKASEPLETNSSPAAILFRPPDFSTLSNVYGGLDPASVIPVWTKTSTPPASASNPGPPGASLGCRIEA